MAVLQTDEFGPCLSETQARRLLLRWNIFSTVNIHGALIFHYPGQDERYVKPVFIHGQGFFFPEHELRKDYVKPAPEPVLTDNPERNSTI